MERELVGSATLAREGEYWAFAFGGGEVRVRDSKGMGYLAELLAHPGVPREALALVAGDSAPSGSVAESAAEGLSVVRDSDSGPVLDAQARREYGARIAELRDEIEEAERFNDPERVAQAREEYAAIARELSSAVGLGGRDRRAGSTAERARVNVTRAVRSAIARIAEHDAQLGAHLDECVRTGRECVYRPQGSLRWTVASGAGGKASDSPTAEEVQVQLPLPPRLEREAARVFVGREEPLGSLIDEFERARSGRLRLAMIAGESGIGKTRLLAQFAQRTHARGAVVMHGSCEEEALVPFGPWVQALDGYASACPLEALRELLAGLGGELARLLPALARRIGDLPPPRAGDAVAERYWLFEAVREFITHLARSRPLLIVLDDLHWADTPTVLLLKHLARADIQAPLLIVGAYRQAELRSEHPLAEAVMALQQEQLVSRLALTGMSDEEVREMISAQTGTEVTRQLAAELHRRTEGHPFFLAELMRSAAPEDRLTVRSLGVPETVRELVSDRVRRQGEPVGRLLGIAAVIGQQFDTHVLRHASDLPDTELFSHLERAAAAGLITDAPGRSASYAFVHALVRDTLYELLSAPHRMHLHERIAKAYETEPEKHLAELAHHYFQASATAEQTLHRAAHYAERAAQQASRQLAYEEAATEYAHAAQALESLGGEPTRRCRVLLALGENLNHSGQFRRAEAVFRAAAELAEQLELAEELALAALGVAGERGQAAAVHDPVLVVLLQRALAGLGGIDTPLRASVMIRLSEAMSFSPRRAEAKALATEAIALARKVGHAGTLAMVLCASQQALRDPDTTAEQLKVVREAERLAREAGATAPLIESCWWQVGGLAELGEIDQARAVVAGMTPLAEQLRQPYYEWMAATARAMIAFLDEPLDQVEQMIWQAADVGRLSESRIVLVYTAIQIGVVRAIQGRQAELRATVEGFAQEVPGTPAYRCAYAQYLCVLGAEAKARKQLEMLAANDFVDLPRDYAWLSCMEYLADVCSHLSAKRHAALLYEQLLPYADRYVVIGHFGVPMGSVHRLLGQLAATCDRREQAREHFEAALERDEQAGSPYAVAALKFRYAELLLADGSPGNRHRAQELLGQAKSLADDFGVKHQKRLMAGDGMSGQTRTRLRDRASDAVGDAKAAVTAGGRAAMARLVKGASDVELERRFGSSAVQRAMVAAMARSFQPRLALGFEGEIGIELEHPAEPIALEEPLAEKSDWWTLDVRGAKVNVSRGPPRDPVVTTHMSVPVFVRLLAGLDTPAAAALWYRARSEGDLVVAGRMLEMFGGINPAELRIADAV